jgi:uncharacterized protein YndB with AHSA1/START domain
MTDRSVVHGSFTIERTYPTTPHRVFTAWARQPEKNRWFGEGDDFLASTSEYTLDFRVGGRERHEGTLPGGTSFGYDAFYQDIVDDRRIVVSYDVRIGGQRVSPLMAREGASTSRPRPATRRRPGPTRPRRCRCTWTSGTGKRVSGWPR